MSHIESKRNIQNQSDNMRKSQTTIRFPDELTASIEAKRLELSELAGFDISLNAFVVKAVKEFVGTVNKPKAQEKPKRFDFKSELLKLYPHTSNDHLDAVIKIRKAKKLVNTQIALDGLVAEFEKSGMGGPACIEKMAKSNWGGFKASWLANEKPSSSNVPDWVTNPKSDLFGGDYIEGEVIK